MRLVHVEQRAGHDEAPPAATGRLLLGDLLDQPDLGLVLVAGGAEARRRPVVGMHSIDIADPCRWLERDWVMLTTGSQLPDDKAAYAALVNQLEQLGAAALGFGLGVGTDGPPPALLAEARRCGLPVFTVPLEVAFREIEVRVHRAHLSEEVRLAQRLSAMQRHLLAGLAEPEPGEAVIGRLATLTGLAVAVLAPSGDVVCQTGSIEVPAAWSELIDGPRATVELELAGGEQCIATPIDDDGTSTAGWLVLVGARPVVPRRLLKSLIQVTRPMLIAASRILDAQRRHERAVRAGLLGALVRHDGPVAAAMLAAPLASAGLDLRDGARAVVIRGGGYDDADVEAVLEAQALASLVMAEERTMTVLALGPLEPLRAALTTLATAGVTIGIGRAVDRIADVPDSYHDAKLALAAGVDGSVTALEDVDLATLLLAEAPTDLTRGRAEVMLAPLQPHPALRETLVAYFAHDLDVVRTANALHLHPNSLRYRLTRIEELIGASLRNVATISTLHLALSACDLHGRPAPSTVVPLKNGA